MLRIILFIAIAVMAIGVLVALFSGWDVNEDSSLDGLSVTVEGRYICLPHTNTSGPQTLECAFGLEADNGENYALQIEDVSAAVAEFNTGERIMVSGILTPREEIQSDDRLLNYDIVGVIKVTSVENADEANGTTDQHTIAGGTLSFERPDNFGLAVTAEQLLIESAIPPCAEGFDYCLYYNTETYANTNFESAGIRIEERLDLVTSETCLMTPPEGYINLMPEMHQGDGYTLSVFDPIRNSATGHTAEGALYRLAYESNCYEIETRIGVSQIENFEEGTVTAFTEEGREAVEQALNGALRTIRLVDRENEIIFPI